MPTPELKAACWSLAKSLAPDRGPTQPLVSKLCRLVKNVLEGDQDDDSLDGGEREHVGRHRKREHPIREQPFCRPLLRLSSWNGFSPVIVIAHIQQPPSAQALYRACSTMIERCTALQNALVGRFPQLESTADVFDH